MSIPNASPLPVLYSFRRCPYAIRARMALVYAGVSVELREVALKNKPSAMLAASKKGTVPVLVLDDGQVIDESIELMRWALAHDDPHSWLGADEATDDVLCGLIAENDGSFKSALDRYKYADRYTEHSAAWYRDQAEEFLRTLEARLAQSDWLLGAQLGFGDVAIFPFIRQFAMVDRSWFDQAPYPRLGRWLNRLLESALFTAVMKKHPPWTPAQSTVIFPGPL